MICLHTDTLISVAIIKRRHRRYLTVFGILFLFQFSFLYCSCTKLRVALVVFLFSALLHIFYIEKRRREKARVRE